MNLKLIICLAFVVDAGAAEKKIEMKDMPPVVQKTIQDETKGAQIEGFSQETEHGKVSYEVETLVNGRHRDVVVDATGAVTEVEEETPIDSIPAAAKAAFEKKAAGGKIRRVETMKRGGATLYEAAYTGKDGKRHEVLVTADGTETKD